MESGGPQCPEKAPQKGKVGGGEAHMGIPPCPAPHLPPCNKNPVLSPLQSGMEETCLWLKEGQPSLVSSCVARRKGGPARSWTRGPILPAPSRRLTASEGKSWLPLPFPASSSLPLNALPAQSRC